MEKKLYELKIDPKISGIAPPLKDCERQLLEEDILQNGCIDPIIIWQGMIIDGHNRYEICHKHGIPFSVVEHEFDSYDDACLWAAVNQLSRRNLTPFQKCEMVLPLKPLFDARARKRQALKGPIEGPPEDVRRHLAELAGVSQTTMGKVLWLHKNADSETFRRLRAGEISISFAYVSLRSVPNEEQVTPSNTRQADRAAEPLPAMGSEIPHKLSDARYLVSELIKEVKKGKNDSGFIIDILEEVSGILARI